MSEEKEEKKDVQEAQKESKDVRNNEPEKKKKSHKFGCIFTIIILIILVLVGYFMFFWSFADGVKSGNLNYLTKKGYLFKTYEGRLIQDGLKSNGGTAGVQSNEFIFSVSDPEVAKKLEAATGQNVQLHYTEYNHALWWRGNSEFVVDSITSIGNSVIYNYDQSSQLSNQSSNMQTSNVEALQNQVYQLQMQVQQLQQQIESMKQSQGQTSSSSNAGQRVFKSPTSNE